MDEQQGHPDTQPEHKHGEHAALSRSSPYWWFKGASVRELYDQLTEYGPDTVRLEVHVHGRDMHFRTIAQDGDELPPVNDSFLCPPVCP